MDKWNDINVCKTESFMRATRTGKFEKRQDLNESGTVILFVIRNCLFAVLC